MKLTFSFTNDPNIDALAKEDIYNSYFEIPDECRFLIGYEQRIDAVAQTVSKFSDAMLHFTCKELGIVQRPIRTTASQETPYSLERGINIAVFKFDRLQGRIQSKLLKIYQPISPDMPQQMSGSKNLKPLG